MHVLLSTTNRLGLLDLSSVHVESLLADNRCRDLHRLIFGRRVRARGRESCRTSRLLGLNDLLHWWCLSGLLLMRLRCRRLALCREVQLLNLLQTRRVHVDHAVRVGLLGLVCRSCASLRIFGEALGEADLAGVHEVPALVLVVMVSIEALLAEVAKIVGRNMRLASVVGDHVALKRTLNTACLAYTHQKRAKSTSNVNHSFLGRE